MKLRAFLIKSRTVCNACDSHLKQWSHDCAGIEISKSGTQLAGSKNLTMI